MAVVIIFVLAIGSLVVTALTIRKALADRAISRRYRAIFDQEAYDLVGKSELPDAHARVLVGLASSRPGWLTRTMVVHAVCQLITGGRVAIIKKPAQQVPTIHQVPQNLRGKYVLALLALAASDSYRSAICGALWRSAHPWIHAALKHIAPDVNSHATKHVVQEVIRSQPKRHVVTLDDNLVTA